VGVEAVHQVLGVYAERDAVGRHAFVLRETLRRRGFRSEVFADVMGGSPAGQARPLRRLPPARQPSTALIYHAATYAPAGEVAGARHEPLIVNYHNITPAEMFEPWEPGEADLLRRGRIQVQNLARRATLAVADSAYNADELRGWGYRDVAVVSCLIDTPRLGPAQRGTGAAGPWPAGTGAKWLFVGRWAPNKAQHDIVMAFKAYRTIYDPGAVLALPGRSSSLRYQKAVEDLVDALDLGDAVLRPGSVTDADLGAYYAAADVFVCLSRHEGFCNTVVEAMAFGVPVLAAGSAALPTTVGDAGLVIQPPARPLTVAAAVHRILTDTRLNRRLRDNGSRRARSLAVADVAEQFCDTIASVVGR
jgi:glycosyltransferase involved in cell wall biosynthesis